MFQSRCFGAAELFPIVDWDYWLSINPAIVAWITVPDTSVDYPIVAASTDEPDYYLSHDVYDSYNLFGCPYSDADCGGGFTSFNTIIYGHHLADGTMFAALSSYADRTFADEHRYICVQTPTEQRLYEVQAADIISGNEPHKRTDFRDQADFLAYYEDCLIRSDMQRFTSTQTSSCLTLCTCSYVFNPANERILIYAKPIMINGQRLGDTPTKSTVNIA